MSFFIGCGLVLEQDNKFILLEETRGAKKGLYNLPAGTLEPNEDLLTCLVRETEEETGFRVDPDCFVGVYQTVLKDGNNILFFVFGGVAQNDVVFKSEHHQNIRVLDYEEIKDLDKSGKLRSPIVMQSITDYKDNIKYPLSIVRSYHLLALDSIVVGK